MITDQPRRRISAQTSAGSATTSRRLVEIGAQHPGEAGMAIVSRLAAKKAGDATTVAFGALKSNDAHFVATLSTALSGDDEGTARFSVEHASVQQVRAALKRLDPEARAGALRFVGQGLKAQPELTPVLIAQLGEFPEAASKALRLGSSDENVVAHLCAAYSTATSDEKRSALLQAMAHRRPLAPSAKSVAEHALSADRCSADRVIGTRLFPRGEGLIDTMLTLIGDPDPKVQAAAVTRIQRADKPDGFASKIVARLGEVSLEADRVRLLAELPALGKEGFDAATIKALRKLVTDGSTSEATHAIAALVTARGAKGEPTRRLFELIGQAGRDDDREISASAIADLVGAGEDLSEPLVRLAMGDDAVSRKLAFANLRRLEPKSRASAKALLLSNVLHEEKAVRDRAHAALDSMTKLDAATLATCKTEVSDPNPAVRARALRILRKLADQCDTVAEVGGVIHMLNMVNGNRFDPKLADLDVDGELRPSFTAAMKDDDEAVRAEASAGLQSLGPLPQGLDAEVRRIHDMMMGGILTPEVRRQRNAEQREIRRFRKLMQGG